MQLAGLSKKTGDYEYNSQRECLDKMIEDMNDLGAGCCMFLRDLKSTFVTADQLSQLFASFYPGGEHFIQWEAFPDNLTLGKEAVELNEAWKQINCARRAVVRCSYIA